MPIFMQYIIISIPFMYLAAVITIILIKKIKYIKYEKEILEPVRAYIEELSDKVEEQLEPKGLIYYKKNDDVHSPSLDCELPMYDVVFNEIYHVCFFFKSWKFI